MTILITGANGFVGRHLVESWPAGERIVAVDTTVVHGAKDASGFPLAFARPNTAFEAAYVHSQADVYRVLRDIKDLTAVVHLAAISHLPACQDDPVKAFHVNTTGALYLMEGVRRIAPQARVILMGSGEEYGEGDVFDGENALRPFNVYGGTKAAASVMAEAFARAYGLHVCMVRPSNIYGPGQDDRKFIPLAIGRLLRGETLTLHNNGAVMRDWVYVTDICQGIHDALERGTPGHAYNLAGNPHDLWTVARMIAGMLDAEFGRNTLPDQIKLQEGGSIAGAVRMLPDAAFNQLQWRASTSLKDGLRATITAILEKETTADA